MSPIIREVVGASLYFLPVQTRVPLKFGTEVLTSVTCARASLTIKDGHGREITGWGETPLSVQWVWPSSAPYEARHKALKDLCASLAQRWASFAISGHALWTGHRFIEDELPLALDEANSERAGMEPIPLLAGLLCNAPFDCALHDACGKALGRPIYETYGPEFLDRDLSEFIEPAAAFREKYPSDFLVRSASPRLKAWHLVGGLDALTDEDLTGNEPRDGYPVTLVEWIRRDGLKCLKVKLRGNDARWDLERLLAVGAIARREGAAYLTADFNCTVREPQYVCDILDEVKATAPEVHAMLLYVEQPFPYELEPDRIDVTSVSRRKPLFLDESAHNWRMVRVGRELGWTGVALKTCKTQTGAILSACWAKKHGMDLMVQDLTNPMLAQIPHVLLAAHVGTIMGVETNAMQFYPEASVPEAKVHPGLYQRRDGEVDLSSLAGAGFGYRLDLIERPLPQPLVFGRG